MTWYNKFKWILGILLVFVIILTTNLIDRSNFIKVRDSVVSIYEDRLVANELIYQMCKAIHQKELAVANSDSEFYEEKNSALNSHIEELLAQFSKTGLTSDERRILTYLRSELDKLYAGEVQMLASEFQSTSEVRRFIFNIQDKLDDLSEIQLHEGSRQMSISQKAVDAVKLFTQLEIYVLVFLAIVIQVIVMYKPKSEEME